ncbi:M48 family metalloprotease [Aestuariivivens insulae]|uniref:M48 family metalloprotease n=1 Tax=Aestuariivivens insulae TaxID=1621988 RepID=UPI001F5A5624|nr:M48 family metallopeptidase [Aestuariivivens insulae]
MTDNLYPASPISLPKNLTKLPSSYQTKAFLAILAIILFFLLYTSLVVGLAYLVYYAFIYEIGHINKITILMKIGAIAGSVMLFVFTLKFIFKLKNHKPKNRIKLTKGDYPEIWDFVYKVCQETGAPKPKSIFADPDVNAYVSYTNMWLSLFLPVKKELTIGLGLVSCLNLSEFKAVISHEFGHFAQRSMKIGSYIISANTIIHDMIFSRDKWDNLLDQWRSSDIRLSAAAWVITPIIWMIRQVLNLFYQFLNIMYSSLSREMEFNADKVAISTSGSDAIISGLWKLDPGFNSWNATINHAYMASQKKQFVKNLYRHNTLSLDRENKVLTNLLNNLPEDSRGGKTYFSSSEHSKVGMYASHPPNDKRQNNAKVPYVSCEIDERSPWLLFPNKETLQQEMTLLVYEQYLTKHPESFISENDFESFIISENQGAELLKAYDNTFENRYLNIPDDDILEKNSKSVNLNKATLDNIKVELKALMEPIKAIEDLMLKASQISEGTTKENSFSFKGQTYKKKNLQEGYSLLFNERETLFNENFKAWDTSFCSFYYALAKKENKHSNLKKLYTQHKDLSNIYRSIVAVKSKIISELNHLQSQEVTQRQVNSFGHKVNDYVISLNQDIEKIEASNFVALPNLDTVQELKEAIVEGGEFKRETGQIFENGGFNRILIGLDSAIQHCQRIDQKSIGVILSHHYDLEKSL